MIIIVQLFMDLVDLLCIYSKLFCVATYSWYLCNNIQIPWTVVVWYHIVVCPASLPNKITSSAYLHFTEITFHQVICSLWIEFSMLMAMFGVYRYLMLHTCLQRVHIKLLQVHCLLVPISVLRINTSYTELKMSIL